MVEQYIILLLVTLSRRDNSLTLVSDVTLVTPIIQMKCIFCNRGKEVIFTIVSGQQACDRRLINFDTPQFVAKLFLIYI